MDTIVGRMLRFKGGGDYSLIPNRKRVEFEKKWLYM